MVKIVIFNYDGVFTNGNIYITDNIAFKQYNCKDAIGISLLKKNNFKTVIISSHKLDINIKELVNHLGIDFYIQSEENKLDALDKFIQSTEDISCSYNDIYYIGDDISDIDIMKKVKFSACPNDAIDSCKDFVDYICNKKGGDGCIREFIDIILNEDKSKNNIHNMIKKIKNETLYQLKEFNYINFDFITHILLISKGNIYVADAGESQNISVYFIDMMESINIKAKHLNILNSTQYDINYDDIIIFFSKNTTDIEYKIETFKCYKICIYCNKKPYFSKYCDYNLLLPYQSELFNNKNIDTNSYISQLFFVNILINNLIQYSNINQIIN